MKSILLAPSNYLMKQAVETAEEAEGKELAEVEIEGVKGFFLKKNLKKGSSFLPVGKFSDRKGNSHYVGHYI